MNIALSSASSPTPARRGLLIPALALALACGTAAPAVAQSGPGSLGNIGSVNNLGGSVDPSSAAAGAATVGSTQVADVPHRGVVVSSGR